MTSQKEPATPSEPVAGAGETGTPEAAATDAANAATEPIATAAEPIATAAVERAPAVPAPAETARPDATPETATPEASVASSTPTAPSASRRNRALGTTGQVAAIVGIVVSLALVVGVLIGRGWLVGKVDDIAGTVDSGLAKGVPLLDNASTRVSEVSGRVGAVEDAANALAANPNPAPGLSEALLAQMAPISERYLALRASYTDVRATVGSTLDRLNTLDQLLPWFSIPQGPVDALATLDTRVQAIDATVTELLTTPGSGAVNAVAAAIATKAGDVQARLDKVTTALDDANTRLAALRVNVQDKADQVKLIATLASIVLILGFLYSAFLHWVLFRASSGRRRKTDRA